MLVPPPYAEVAKPPIIAGIKAETFAEYCLLAAGIGCALYAAYAGYKATKKPAEK